MKSIKASDIAQNHLQELANGKGAPHNLESGLDFLDQWEPIRTGETIILGARPGMGKTIFCINLALSVSKRYKTLYVTSDATKEQLTEGMLSNLGTVDSNTFSLDSSINAALGDVFNDEIKQLESRQLYILETSDYYHKEYLQTLENQLKEYDFEFLIIQPGFLLKTVKPNRKDVMKNRKIVAKIKELCSTYKVNLLVTVHLPSSVEKRQNKVPMYSDIAHLGIEKMFDKVMLLFRPEYYGITMDEQGEDIKGLTNLIIARNNFGSIGQVQLRLIRKYRQLVAWDEL